MDPLDAKNIYKLHRDDYSYLLKKVKKTPGSMDIIGIMPPETHKYLCVVGPRTFSAYGKEACEKLIAGLAGYPVVIVSGLALGIDSIAHRAALKAGILTIAFPGSGLHIPAIYPQVHLDLARDIVNAGGALVSPFKRDVSGPIWAFPVRNKLMAGISHATLVIEARKDSGSLITATDAGKFNRDLMVIPGSIFSSTSEGSNQLLREGAIAVTSSEEILEVLGLINTKTSSNENQKLFAPRLSNEEKMVLEKITVPIERDELIRKLDMPAGYINSILLELELKNVIKERQGVLMVN
jgi:DNA processing protein